MGADRRGSWGQSNHGCDPAEELERLTAVAEDVFGEGANTSKGGERNRMVEPKSKRGDDLLGWGPMSPVPRPGNVWEREQNQMA